MNTTVHLLVRVKNEKPLYEEVHVEDRGARTYRLLQSPGLVLDLAADDVFLLEPGGTFKLLQRGGNIAIQMFGRQPLDSIEPLVTPELTQIGGWLDGQTTKELVYTISAKVGFPDIERVLKSIETKFPMIEWVYGNVYDPVDGVTPLNWWLDP